MGPHTYEELKGEGWGLRAWSSRCIMWGVGVWGVGQYRVDETNVCDALVVGRKEDLALAW